MSGTEQLIVLGFDSMDPGIVRTMADAGELPTFRRLLDTGPVAPLLSPRGFFVDDAWRSLWSGLESRRLLTHCWEEVVPGDYGKRICAPENLVPFWRSVVRAGRRVAVVDVPRSVAEEPGEGGIQVSEMMAHDRHLGRRILPPELRQRLVERYPVHPVLGVEPDLPMRFAPDDYVFREGALRTDEEQGHLLRGLLAGADIKCRLLIDLQQSAEWDLFFAVYGEAHSVGHHQWHIHDPGHARHDPALASTLGDPVAQVYRRLDDALATHLRVAGEGASVLVILSHGIGPHHDGTHLLSEILRRLDEVRRTGRCAVGGHAVRPHDTEESRRRQRFFVAPSNDPVGGVRLNLCGRERDGCVAQGREAEDEMRWLSDALTALVNADTGRPAVRCVEPVAAHHPRGGVHAFPDLFVEWNHEAPIDAVTSADVGLIRRVYSGWRTGDHRPDGLLLLREPGGSGPATHAAVRTVDVAPSLAARLGVSLHAVDGTAVPWLASGAAVAPA